VTVQDIADWISTATSCRLTTKEGDSLTAVFDPSRTARVEFRSECGAAVVHRVSF
jgi:hypothetical protein